MSIKGRLSRLETVATGIGEPDRMALDESLAELPVDRATVTAWLEQHGYGNVLEAVAAGETGPTLRTEGWSLATIAKNVERDTVAEQVYADLDGTNPLWCHRDRGWCAPINGRLEYLGPKDDYGGAVTRFRELTGLTPATDQRADDADAQALPSG